MQLRNGNSTFTARKIGFGRVPLPHPRRRCEISTWLYTVTIHRAFVRLTGHTLYGSESNRLMLPSHYQIGISPPEGCAHFSCRRLPSRPSPTKRSANLLPVFACRVPGTAWQDHPPSAGLPQHSRCLCTSLRNVSYDLDWLRPRSQARDMCCSGSSGRPVRQEHQPAFRCRNAMRHSFG